MTGCWTTPYRSGFHAQSIANTAATSRRWISDGSLLQSDKSVWVQGRFAWLLATLFDTVERRAEWLELSRHGIDFINRHCFDTDGRMFFSVTREGRPLRKRRYLFSEAFAVIALAAFGRAAGDAALESDRRSICSACS